MADVDVPGGSSFLRWSTVAGAPRIRAAPGRPLLFEEGRAGDAVEEDLASLRPRAPRASS